MIPHNSPTNDALIKELTFALKSVSEGMKKFGQNISACKFAGQKPEFVE
jgi:hypothetical protein